MSFIEDFPHTSIYDKDLGWLIRQYKELNDNYEVLKDIYNIVKKQITDITLGQLKEWLDDGTIESLITKKLFNSKLSYFTTFASFLKTEPQENMIIATFGYNDINDGGNGFYNISKVAEDFSIPLQNGLYANLIYSDYVNVASLGVIPSMNDVSNQLNTLFNKKENINFYIPSGTYLIENQISIVKPITIRGVMGDSIHITSTMNGTIFKLSKTLKIIHNDVVIDGISFTTESCPTAIEVLPSTQPANVSMNIRLRNIIVRDFSESGITINRLITSILDNVYVGNCGVGININGNTQTSIKLNKCWCLNCTKGFYIHASHYCEFSNCCSDDCSEYGYELDNCNGTVLTACGCETTGKTPFVIKDCLGTCLVGCFSVNCNNNSSISCIDIKGSNVTINNFTEKTPKSGTKAVSWDDTSLVEISGSTFAKWVETSKRKGFIRDMFLATPNYLNQNEIGYTVEISGSDGYTAPGNKSMTWLVFVVINNRTTGAYEGTKTVLAVGGNSVVNKGEQKNCNGFAIRIT